MPSAATVARQVEMLPSVRAGVERIAKEVETEARQIAARRAHQDGTYAALIRAGDADPVTARASVVAGARTSKWLEEGTGIYGPTRQPIRPKRGKFLVFRATTKQGGPAPMMRTATGGIVGKRQPVKPGDLVFARQVRGRPASWVLRDAAMAVAAAHPGTTFRNRRTWQG